MNMLWRVVNGVFFIAGLAATASVIYVMNLDKSGNSIARLPIQSVKISKMKPIAKPNKTTRRANTSKQVKTRKSSKSIDSIITGSIDPIERLIKKSK